MRTHTALLTLFGMVSACGPPERNELLLVARYPLAPAAAAARTLTVDSAGITLGVPGVLLRMDSMGARVIERIPLPDTTAPRVLGTLERATLVWQGKHLVLARSDPDAVVREPVSAGTAVAALDPRRRFVLRGAASGAALGLDLDSLQARWSWPRLGRATTALAFAPEGDQVYLSLAASEAEEARPEILARDAQTGRELHRGELPWPARDMIAAPQGRLYVLVARGERGAVLGLAVGPDGVRERWRRALGRLGLPTAARLALSPEGNRLAIYAPGSDGGIAVLDARTGESVGQGSAGLLDAAFDARGALWLLREGELVQVDVAAGRTPR